MAVGSIIMEADMTPLTLTTPEVVQTLIRIPARGAIRRRLELAAELGVDESYITRLIKGERQPSTKIASRLADLSGRIAEIRGGKHVFLRRRAATKGGPIIR